MARLSARLIAWRVAALVVAIAVLGFAIAAAVRPAPARSTGQGAAPAVAREPGAPAPTSRGATPPAGAGPTSPGASATRPATPSPEGSPSANDLAVPFILLRAETLTPAAPLNFMGYGFQAGEQLAVAIADPQGRPEARLEPVAVDADGRLNEVSQALPADLLPGDHVLRVEGALSHRAAQVTFRLRGIPPKVTLDSYSVKPDREFGFSGSGFNPGEEVTVHIGGLEGEPLARFQATAAGTVSGRVAVPFIPPGDYPLYVLGTQSQAPVSVGLNVQGFSPWVVLDNYAAPPYYQMGFTGEDFAADEPVLVYLGKQEGTPVARVAADHDGRLAAKAAFELPGVPGDSKLIFVGGRTGKPVVVAFTVQPFAPSLELTAYAGLPGSPVALIGSGWARNEPLRAFVGDRSRQEVGTLQADPGGAFRGAGAFRLPIHAGPGAVAVTVVGEVSHAEVTVYFQALEIKPSAELTAYTGPPGTVVAFTGRGFAGGERVQVHLRDKDGPVLAEATADDQGTFERLSAYPVAGDWGDVIPFVMVGIDSGGAATTHFKIASP